MITYEQYEQIHHYARVLKLTRAQIAARLGLQSRTVAKWLARDHFAARLTTKRPSRLDPFKPQIVRWLEAHPFSATQIFQKLKEIGYSGGITILRDYVRCARPAAAESFLTLHFQPGECAQVDWGQFGTVPVGNTTRRLSFFVMVLCHSRMLYVEFTLAETMEHFLDCHQNAFAFFGAVPRRVMVDNLKSAVLRRVIGEDPVLNPRYKDFAAHYGFTISPCSVRQPQQKGRVENAVGYVKKNFLAGLELTDFCVLNPAVRQWLEGIANVRLHGTTKRRPVDLFAEEKPALRPRPHAPYDVGQIRPARANNRFRVAFDANSYSVPAEYASALLTLKVYPDELCIYREDRLIARHVRCYDRHQDFEHPDHPKPLLLQRSRAREQRLLQRFLSLTPKAEAFYRQLQEHRFNTLHHVRKIVALSEIYGVEKTVRAIQDALEFHAFSSEYIANLLEQYERRLPEPGPLMLTRRQDLLDLELPEPDLGLYDAGEEPPPPQTTGEDDHAMETPPTV
jgi:transposase